MDTKQQLQKFIEQIKAKQFRDNEAQGLTKSVGGEITKQLKPAFEGLAKELTGNISSAIKELKINVPESKQAQVNVNVPDVIVPDIRVPEPKVTVNIPPFPKIPEFPKLEMPETMKVFGSVEIVNNDYKNPLKVQLVDLMNRPYESVGGGGFAGAMKINNTSSEAIPVYVTSGASATSATNIVDSSGVAYSGSNPIPVTITSGSTATTAVQNLNADGTYRDTFPVSGSVTISGTVTGITNTVGVYNLDSAGNYKDTYPISGTVTGITNTIATANIDSSGIQYSGSNPMPVTTQRALESLGLDVLSVRQVSGASHSVNVLGFSASVGATILNGEGLARDSWLVSDITNSVKSALIDSTGVQYSGSNPLPITIISTASAGATGSMAVSVIGSDGLAFGTSKPIPVTMVAGVSGTTGTANVDSSGVQYSGSNPMPTYLVAGAGNSTVSVGPVVSDAVDDGSAPIKNGGIARTANPTAVAGGDIVTYSADDLGRQITRPVQARDLIATAYVSKATGSTFGTETTLLAETAGSMFDLIYIMGTNDSSVGIQCDIRGVTAGNVLMSLYIPPYSTAGISTPVPLPQTTSDTGNAWTIDLPDVTGTNVNVSALFTKEI